MHDWKNSKAPALVAPAFVMCVLSGGVPAMADDPHGPLWCDGEYDSRTGFCYDRTTGQHYNRYGETYNEIPHNPYDVTFEGDIEADNDSWRNPSEEMMVSVIEGSVAVPMGAAVLAATAICRSRGVADVTMSVRLGVAAVGAVDGTVQIRFDCDELE